MIYAGVGSRETPPDVCDRMREIARYLGVRGWLLRSGHAIRADMAFEMGAGDVKGPMEIFTSKDVDIAAYLHASLYHPAWAKLDEGSRSLHARNSLIMLGRDLLAKVDCVVCWTPGGRVQGGTGQALRIAASPEHRTPVFNLAHDRGARNLFDFVQSRTPS